MQRRYIYLLFFWLILALPSRADFQNTVGKGHRMEGPELTRQGISALSADKGGRLWIIVETDVGGAPDDEQSLYHLEHTIQIIEPGAHIS